MLLFSFIFFLNQVHALILWATMNSMNLIAGWYGGQKICATRHPWMVNRRLGLSIQSCEEVVFEMWMPFVDT